MSDEDVDGGGETAAPVTIPATIVWFMDGTTATVPINGRILCEVERKYGRVRDSEAEFYAAWWGLGRPLGQFDNWLDTVATIEAARHELPDPTKPGPAPG